MLFLVGSKIKTINDQNLHIKYRYLIITILNMIIFCNYIYFFSTYEVNIDMLLTSILELNFYINRP